MHRKPRILSVSTISKTRIFTVEELELQFADGKTTRYERISGGRNGAVLAVPLLDEDTVLLVREYAAGTDRFELGLPKGRMEDNETALAAANREMMEEIGYGANRLDLITSLTIAPGYISAQTHIVLARDLYPKRLTGDEPEELEVVPWSLSQINSLLTQPDFSEARSLAALYLVREIVNNQLELST